jgi:hypothetical protein
MMALPKQTTNRHVNIKLFRARVQKKNSVLAIIIGVNFLKDKEFFEKRHLLAAIKVHIPCAVHVEGSYITSRRGHENFCHLYLEVEKTTGEEFTAKEISLLRQELPLEIKDLVEQPVHPVFMPRNEEEIMRYVLILSNQIKYIKDIPQVVINFDEQTHSHLFFNIILVQCVKPGTKSLQMLLQANQTKLEYIHERTKTVGFLRNKYTKEAVILRAKLPKEYFLRRDHSIDLYKARQEIVEELSSLIGDVRDFNGGMIAKQNETLSGVRELLTETVKYNEHLLENFFFSIMPPMIRTIIEPVAVKTVYMMIQELVENISSHSEGGFHVIRAVPDFVFVVIKGGSSALREDVSAKFCPPQYHPTEIASAFVRVHEVPYLGYIYRCDDEKKQALFCQGIENMLTAWNFKTAGLQGIKKNKTNDR